MSKPGATPDPKKALLQAYDQVLKTQHEKREAERRTSAQPSSRIRVSAITWGGLFIILFTAAYLWLERPDWVFPPPAAPESTAIKEASLRISLANAARHIDHFHRKTGRLPATLQEAGTLAAGITYEADGTTGYLLRGTNGAVRLSLRSTDSLPTFVGNSFEIIARRSR